MKKTHILFAFILTSLVAIAATSWAPTTGSVKFFIKNAGFTVEGTLSGISASVKFDENDLTNSSIFASVKVATINTGINKRDKHLQGEEYFNAAKYPEITLKSTSITKTSKGYLGKFNVTMKGKTKSVDMPFTFTNSGETGKFSGILKLDRLDFGVGESSFVLSDDVKIKITLNVKKK
ncbi:MAG: hypothetical protein COA58_08010 [Bacteroidetes bacterium]|nr:MAG: hypothetical protein COA58_08010 [Bacteroidota bacterium]